MELCSKTEVEQAKQYLNDKENRKRMRSSMVWWLEQQGLKDKYDASAMASRKKIMEAYVAKHLKEKGEKSFTSSRTIDTSKVNTRGFEWIAKEQMLGIKGQHKTELIIKTCEGDPKHHRP